MLTGSLKKHRTFVPIGVYWNEYMSGYTIRYYSDSTDGTPYSAAISGSEAGSSTALSVVEVSSSFSPHPTAPSPSKTPRASALDFEMVVDVVGSQWVQTE